MGENGRYVRYVRKIRSDNGRYVRTVKMGENGKIRGRYGKNGRYVRYVRKIRSESVEIRNP